LLGRGEGQETVQQKVDVRGPRRSRVTRQRRPACGHAVDGHRGAFWIGVDGDQRGRRRRGRRRRARREEGGGGGGGGRGGGREPPRGRPRWAGAGAPGGKRCRSC